MALDPISGLVAVSLGLGLSAASGFRVFLPPMLLSGAINFGLMDPSGHLAMLDGWGAFSLLLIAVVLEIGSYLIPWVDNLLDVVASPAAVVAGIALMGTVLGSETNFDPIVQWSIRRCWGWGRRWYCSGGNRRNTRRFNRNNGWAR